MKEQDWFFTFGFGQVNHGFIVKIFGTHEEAEKTMFDIFGHQWGLQYSRAHFNEARVNMPDDMPIITIPRRAKWKT